MRFRPLIPAALAAAGALASPAIAHRMWLLPSTTTLSGTDEWVTLDAAVSNDLFYADHVPLRPEQVKVWAPDGSTPAIQNPSTSRYRSTFDVRVDRPGTWRIGVEQNSVTGSFKVDGAEWRVGGRRPGGPGAMGGSAGMGGAGGPLPGAQRGGEGREGGPPRPSVATVAEIPANATDVKLTEVSSRNYVFVTAGQPSTAAFAPTGRGLEMQPVTHPDALVSNEEGQFRFTVDGRPAAGVKVSVVPGSKKYRAAENAQELVTGADGLLRVRWPVAGVYWISATATDGHATTPRATEQRMTYTMTVEVPAP